MGIEIDLLKNYPKSKRNLSDRLENKTDKDRSIARNFDIEFFDGKRSTGYGGFKYDEKFWTPVIPDFINYWKINNSNSLLDVGCAKGFMLYDFKKFLPSLNIEGIDISEYAVKNSIPSVTNFLKVGNAKSLPYNNNEFDFTISINTIHNLEQGDCIKALKEIQRVTKYKSFITVDAYRSEIEKDSMYAWNLTAKTILSVGGWIKLFNEVDFEGDYFWFIP